MIAALAVPIVNTIVELQKTCSTCVCNLCCNSLYKVVGVVILPGDMFEKNFSDGVVTVVVVKRSE